MSTAVATKIQEYWENPSTVSIIDKNLHKIEIDTVLRHLRSSDKLADIGCGDGSATVHYAPRVRECVAFERSNHLREQARQAMETAKLENMAVLPGDVLDMSGFDEQFDSVVTQRCLINMESWETQQQALDNVYRVLKPGGRYVMVENTNDAFAAMNDMRVEVGLDPVPQHWHNRFFDYEQMMDHMNGKFQLLKNYDFGLYYLLTRVYTSMFASFQGYGNNAVKDPIYERADAAARVMFEKFKDRIEIKGCRAFGPIQVFVFRREM